MTPHNREKQAYQPPNTLRPPRWERSVGRLPAARYSHMGNSTLQYHELQMYVAWHFSFIGVGCLRVKLCGAVALVQQLTHYILVALDRQNILLVTSGFGGIACEGVRTHAPAAVAMPWSLATVVIYPLLLTVLSPPLPVTFSARSIIITPNSPSLLSQEAVLITKYTWIDFYHCPTYTNSLPVSTPPSPARPPPVPPRPQPKRTRAPAL